jgi:hypothetical protein
MPEYPVKYLAGLLFGPDFDPEEELYPRLEDIFGPIDSESADHPFDMTDYYSGEMGGGLLRRFVSFSGLGSPLDLVKKKLACRAVEDKFLRKGNRRVNIDPGYLDYFKLVLASFKEGPQKIYLGRMVFADMILLYESGDFRVLPWTFPDFAGGRYMDYLRTVREAYRIERRSISPD